MTTTRLHPSHRSDPEHTSPDTPDLRVLDAHLDALESSIQLLHAHLAKFDLHLASLHDERRRRASWRRF